jgi:hypothetical protein
MTTTREQLRDLGTEIVRLRSTPLKGMKTSQKAAIIEAVQDMKIKIATLVQETPVLSGVADKHMKALTEYEDELDAADAPPPPPEAAPAPAPAAGPVDDAPPGEEPAEGSEVDVINRAADKLDDLAGDDPEAAEIASELHAVADTMAGDAGEELPPDDFGGEDDGGGAPIDDIPMESRRGKRKWTVRGLIETVRRLRTRLRRSESQHNRLASATAKILERYRAQKDSTRGQNLGEDDQGRTIGDYKQAASDLAERYNRDMVEMGLLLFKAKRPELFEAHGETLRKTSRGWKHFYTQVEAITKKAGGASALPPVVESAPPAAPAAPVPPSGTPPAAPVAPAPDLTEDVHPSIRMTTRARARLALRG